LPYSQPYCICLRESMMSSSYNQWNTGVNATTLKCSRSQLSAGSEMPANNNELEKKLWDAADELRANSKLKSSEYSMPVLGLVFLKWTDFKFAHAERELEEEAKKSSSSRRREISKVDYHARGVIYVPDKARYSYLMVLPESTDIGRAMNDAMELIEAENEDLMGVLPKTYQNFESRVLLSLLRTFNSIPMDIEGDAFGRTYEYFLGKFAMAEGQKGGEFFTPTSIVRLIVEILEPFHGRIYDPACGSGGMFVQSARFVKEHQRNPSEEISIYGQERVSETVKLCKMNLAVHGLAGDIREGNTYYEDIHVSRGRFDFVMANPPFNVDRVDKDRIKDDPRFPFGLPKVDNANYLWIQVFMSALNDGGRAGFVMANSAADAQYSELEVRQGMIKSGVVDAVILLGPKLFYTVALPCSLWFFDRKKQTTKRKGSILFIDARGIYVDVDRRHRELTEDQIDFIADIVRLYRGDRAKLGKEKMEKCIDLGEFGNHSVGDLFPDCVFKDVTGLCKAVDLTDIKKSSLNPGRYVGVQAENVDSEDFRERMSSLFEECMVLKQNAIRLQGIIERIVSELMGLSSQ